MTAPGRNLVVLFMAGQADFTTWRAHDWTLLVQQARASGMLGRIAEWSARHHAQAPWPAAAAAHFDAAGRVCAAQHAEIHREVGHLQQALADLGAPVVLLKGSAYVMAGLPAAGGRVFGDIDIMVPKAALAEAEARLVMNGWITTHTSAYDQRYYRQWMHELPPMQHVQRRTTLDVHHSILPETARLHPSPEKLFAQVQPLPGRRGLCVLCPADMVLHSATHLFLNDDMSYGLRDLADLDLLLRHFGNESRFWTELVTRAVELDLTRPLHYALRHTTGVLGTPVPAPTLIQTQNFGPPLPLRRLMDAIWQHALRPQHASASATGSSAALFALYVRAHWLRMPPVMLTRHLTTKALQRLRGLPRTDQAPGV